jgi:hypothetical protein
MSELYLSKLLSEEHGGYPSHEERRTVVPRDGLAQGPLAGRDPRGRDPDESLVRPLDRALRFKIGINDVTKEEKSHG